MSRGPRFVGAVTVAVVLAIVALLFAPAGLALGRQTYYAELARAGGLGPGDEVRVAGVGVGEVTELEIRDAKVHVSFRLSDEVALGRDSRADVKVATLLGTHYLALSPGGGGALAGRTIPLANTTVPFEIQEIVEAGGTALEKLDGARLRQALRALADGFRDAPPLTRATLDGVARLSDVVVTRRDQLQELVRQSAAVAGNLDANREELVDLLRQASLILDEVTRRRDVIAELLVDTRALARTLSGIVRDNQARIAPLLENVNVVLGTLRDNRDALEEIATLLGPASRYFANAAGNGPYIDVNGPNAVLPDSLLCVPQQRCG